MITRKGAMIALIDRHKMNGGFASLYEQERRVLTYRPMFPRPRNPELPAAVIAELERMSPMVANAIKPIVGAVADIICTNSRILAAMFDRRDSEIPFPLPETAADPRGIVIYNPQVPPDISVPCSEDFGLGGRFGLRAIVIGIDDHRPQFNEVSLVFDDRNHQPNGFTYLRLTRSGKTHGGTISFTPYRDEIDTALGVKRRAPGRYDTHRRASDILHHGSEVEILTTLDHLVQYLHGIARVFGGESTPVPSP